LVETLEMSEASNSTSTARKRESDFSLFTSEHARTLTRNEGIGLAGYRKLRDATRAAGSQGEWN
jgi:hypothetical protein